MNEYQWLINKRANEKRERAMLRAGERDRIVGFDEWTSHTYGILDPRSVPKKERNKLYDEYQHEMIQMGFTEWQRAAYWGVSPFYDLFG